MRSDDLLTLPDLPELHDKYSCDDLYWWRQEVLMIYSRDIDTREDQLRKHQ
jgi:hypothetical protein